MSRINDLYLGIKSDIYQGIKRNIWRMLAYTIALGVISAVGYNEFSFSRQNLQVNNGQSTVNYKVFQRDDEVRFRKMLVDGRNVHGVMTPDLVGSIQEGYSHTIQPMPGRGLGVITIASDHTLAKGHEERFNSLLRQYVTEKN